MKSLNKRNVINTRRYTTAQLLRYPLIFGSVLGAYWFMYSKRLTLFSSDIAAVKQKNLDERPQKDQVLDHMRKEANTGIIEKRRQAKS